jgi:hypothetical protein
MPLYGGGRKVISLLTLVSQGRLGYLGLSYAKRSIFSSKTFSFNMVKITLDHVDT